MSNETHTADCTAPDCESEQGRDAALADLEAAITNYPPHREAFYKLLSTCRTRKTTAELEEEIASWPEFEAVLQDQYWLISTMVKHKGLHTLHVDADGNLVDEDRIAAMTEDEFFETVADEAFEITELGEAVIEAQSPRKRLDTLLAQVPARLETYLEVLEFCKDTARSYPAICDLLKNNPIMVGGSQQSMQPSVFVDKLEMTGVIEWRNGWLLTDEGKEILKEIESSR